MGCEERMQVTELIEKINRSVEEFDYVRARKYIEENLEVLEAKKLYLKSNAREIHKFLSEQLKSGVPPISRSDLAVINSINAYAYQFDLRGIKVVLRDHARLFLKEEAVAYLNSDAKTILSGMKVING